MAQRCRRFDWSGTALGPVEDWSPVLCIAVATALSSRHPILLMWGPEHVQIYNDAYMDTLGERHPAALGATARASWPDAWEVIRPQLDQVLSGGGGTWYEDQEVPLRRDGRMEPTWWTYSYSPVRGGDGTIEGVMVLAQETTARVQAEARVRTLADRLGRVLESMTDGFLILDLDWRFTFVNAEASRLVERPREELIGQSVWTAFPKSRGSHIEEGFRRAREEGITVRFEEFFSARMLWLEIRAYPWEEGLAVFLQDITAGKEAEARAREEGDRLRRAFEGAAPGIWITWKDRGEQYVNPAFARILGATPEEMAQQDFRQLTHPEDLPENEALYAEMVEGKRDGFVMEKRYLRRDGGIAWVRVSVSALRGADGGVQQTIAVAEDITASRGAMQRLRESERRFRELAESMPFIVWTADATGSVDYQTRAIMDLTGRGPEGLVGEAWIEVVHPDDREHTLAAWHEAVEKGEAYGVEFRIRRTDGVYRWHLTRAVPVRDDSGRIVKWYGSSTDIHDIRDGEARIRESEERFRVVARATADAIWDWDLRTDEIWWSEGLQRIFGVPIAEAESWADRIHPEDREGALREMDQVISGTGDDWQGEYRFRRGDGAYAWVVDRAFVIRDGEGRAIRMVGGMSDETHEMEAQRRIREQAELLDRARDAILVRRLDHTVEYWNHGAEAMYGWSREEALGHSVKDLLYNQHSPFAEATEQVVRDGEWQGELEQVCRDGTPIVVEASWSLMRDPDGAPRRILAIHTDVTERKKLQAQFFRAQRLESIGTLAGGIAHDLNNVLSPILMSMGLLRTMWKDQESVEILSAIEGSARRGADMVRQVLAFARGVDGVRVAVDLSRIVDDLGRVVRDTFPRNISFRARIPPGLWSLHGDPTQVHQVLMNLFVNARDAMPGGGGLTVEAANVRLDEQYAAMSSRSNPGPYVRITVADTGEGMAPAIVERAFEPFFTTKEVGSGTGLGLSTVDAIVRSHGGFVNVYSEPGKGTTFRVYFPAGEGEGSELASEEPLGALPPGKGELILVVDDEAAVLTITRQTLEAFGYRVVTASDGAEAVVIFARQGHEVDLVLTDISMPIMDGPATIRALLKMDPDLRIVATSGHGGNGGSQSAAAYGVRDFLAKPYTAEALLEVVQRVLAEGEERGGAGG